MKLHHFIIALCLFLSTLSYGQFNHVFVEVGGSGLYGSLNWERTLIERKSFLLGGRVGLSTFHVMDHNNKFNPDIIIPFGPHVLLGAGHHVELAMGNTFSSMVSSSSTGASERQGRVHGTAFLGYRYQNDKYGYVLRAGYSPFLENYSRYYHWGAVSFGYRF